MKRPNPGHQGLATPGGGLAPAHEIIERALGASKGSACTVLVEDASQAEVRFANNTLTTNGVRRDRRVTVISFHDHDHGTSVGVSSESGDVPVHELIQAAETDAREAPPATDAAPLLGPGSATPSRDAPSFEANMSAGETDLSVFSDMLPELGSAFQRARSSGTVLAGFAEHDVTTTFLGSSTGLRQRHVQPTGALQMVARSTEGGRSAWVGVGTKDFRDVSLQAVEERLLRRFDWSSRRIELEAGRYQVLLPPDAVADLMVIALEAMDGRDAEEGRSVYSAPGGGTRVGEALSTVPFRLRSDPNQPTLECSPFLATAVSSSDVSVFDNGLPLSPTAWIDGGRLQRLRYHRAGAAQSGVEAVAPIDNLMLEVPGASAGLDEMIASTERGLLLTCLWYIREVDPTTLLMTGLTRDGVYLVEDGKVRGAVNNFRFNESPVDLLARATEVSTTERALGRELGEWYNRTAMPALRIPDFNMSSVSPAS